MKLYNVPTILRHIILKHQWSLLASIILLGNFVGHTQSTTIEDVYLLRSYIDDTDLQFNYIGNREMDIAAIFYKHESLTSFVNPNDDFNASEKYKMFYTNPFILSYLEERKNEDSGVVLNATVNSSISSIVPDLTEGSSIITIADGLAKFYVKRVKEELNLAFFNKFKRLIKENEEFRILFPSTAAELVNIGDKIYHYESYLKVLREKFFFDLNNLDIHAAQLLEDLTVHMDEDLRIVAIDALNISYQIRSGDFSPPKVVHYLGQDAKLHSSTNPKLQNTSSALKLLDIFSEGLISADDSTWISYQEFIAIADDPVKFDLFLGLLYQKAKTLKFDGKTVEELIYDHLGLTVGSTINSLTAKQSEQLEVIKEKFRKALNKLILEGNQANDGLQLLRVKKTAKDSIKYEDYYRLIRPTLNIIVNATDFYEVIAKKPNKKVIEQIHEGVLVASNINEAILAISQQKYPIAIANVAAILNRIKLDNNKVVNNFLDFGYFMIAIVEAKDSDAAAAAIEAFALPAGSSMAKKAHAFSIEVNGYTGFRFGSEELNGHASSDGEIMAIHAPLGVALSFGLGRYGSLSAYGTVLDIGALTAFRFNDNTTKELPEFDFANIYAPGIYGVWGIPNVPLSLGFGYQDGPQLRKITATDTVTDGKASWNIFLSVDIPLVEIKRWK